MPETLKGKKILVTRPGKQADNICSLIEQKGGVAVRLPVIEIRPVADNPRIREYLAGISSYDIGIFISQNAVRFTLELLDKDIHALFDLKIVAIGKATARLLKEAGIPNIEFVDTVSSSEALLELPVFSNHNIKGAKIIIFRGTGGREYLAERLLERGAYVDYVEVYHRLPCRYDNSLLNHIFFEIRPDTVIVTSGEGLQNLFDILNPEQRDVLLHTQLVVMSNRIEEQAIKLGFSKRPVVAEETSDQGLLSTIMHTSFGETGS